MKEVRKPRNKMSKKVDTLFPIDILKFGSDEDPCFGKLFHPTADECMVCGDCELCQIATAQNLHKRRLIEEGKGKFKDLEEKEIFAAKVVDDTQSTLHDIKRSIRKKVKKYKKIELSTLSARVHKNHRDFSEDRIRKIIIKMGKVTKKFKIKNGTAIWVD